jgi:hypothetical protein
MARTDTNEIIEDIIYKALCADPRISIYEDPCMVWKVDGTHSTEMIVKVEHDKQPYVVQIRDWEE